MVCYRESRHQDGDVELDKPASDLGSVMAQLGDLG